MRIRSCSQNIISFKYYYTTGRDADNLSNTLKPYHEKLNEITRGFNVKIETGKPLYLHDGYHDEIIPIYPTKATIEPEINSAYYSVPKIKLYINHAANPCLGSKFEAKDIINTVKKGINIYKNL